MLKNWRSTALGIAAVIAAISSAAVALLDLDPTTNPDWTLLSAAIAAGLGNIVSKDAADK